MAHHSHLEISGHTFLYTGNGYLPELVGVFTEADRRPADLPSLSGREQAEFIYTTTVGRLQERLHVQGFTASRAQADLAETLADWQKKRPLGWSKMVPTVQSVEDSLRHLLDMPFEEAWATSGGSLYDLPLQLSRDMDCRSFARLLLEWAPEPDDEASLNLSDLTGCCVELDPIDQVADRERAEQLAALTDTAPLLVLTEGISDARLLAAGMSVTHPHLQGFINFFDFSAAPAEGGVAQLAKTVSAFAAAGVANRFVALADNDTEGHAGLARLKKQTLPERCRILHYPPLPYLETYPTLGPYGDGPVFADINGRAGSLEMYLGRDALRSKDSLAPVQWRSWNKNLCRYHGALADDDKKAVQDRFLAKVNAHRMGKEEEHADWYGIRAIISSIVTAFD